MSCFSRLFLTKVKVSINVSGVIRKSALNYCLMARSFLLFHMCETIALLGERSKPFFHLSNQWSIMQYLNFVSKKIFFSAVSIYGLLFLRGFWRLLINCLSIKISNFSFITAYFFTSTVFIFFTSTENPFVYFKAAFTLIYILIVNILSANKIIYKWPHLYIKTQIHK